MVEENKQNKEIINIGILGLGTVGTGTVNILTENRHDIELRSGASINVKKVLVKNKNKKRNFKNSNIILTDNADEIINDSEIDIIVELIGGVEPAFDYIIKAIENGKHT
jgi:homoserine dehydrogenase